MPDRKPVILDFSRKKVLQFGDEGYDAALRIHLMRMAAQTMGRVGYQPPPRGETPDA